MNTKFVPDTMAIYHITDENNSYLSHFLFTEMLLPLMIETSKQEGSDVRIINVSRETPVHSHSDEENN
jgi:hypothetical protein